MRTRRKDVRNAVDREAALARYHELLQTARLNHREAFKLMVEHRLWEAEGLKPTEMFARDFDRTPETFRNWLKRDGYEHLIDPVKSAAGKAGAEAKHEGGCQKILARTTSRRRQRNRPTRTRCPNAASPRAPPFRPSSLWPPR